MARPRGLRWSGCWQAVLLALLVAAVPGCRARTRPNPGDESALTLRCEDCGKVIRPGRTSARGADLAQTGLCLACAQEQAEMRSVTLLLCPGCGREVGREESVETLRRADVTRAEWDTRTHITVALAPSPCGVCRRAAGRTAAYERAQAEREMRSYQGEPAAIAISEVRRQAACAGVPAGDGYEFVLVHLWIRNVGRPTIRVSPRNGRIVTERRYDLRPHAVTARIEGGFRESDLEPGEMTHGWVAYRTMRADPPWLLVHQNSRIGTVKFGPVYKPVVLP